MNILIYNWRDPKHPKAGGAEIVTMEHAKAWVKHGHTVTWFTSSFAGAKPEETVDGVRFVRRGTVFTVHLLAPLFYWFSGFSFDVVVDEIHGLPFFTPLYVRKPKVAFIHEVADEIWEYVGFFPFNRLGRVLEKLYFKLYAHVPFWTDAPSTVLDLTSVGIRKDQCIVIPCPITNKAVMRLPQKEKHPTFLFVSRIVKMKGIEDALRSFVLMQKRLPTAVLWVIGSGDSGYIERLKRLTLELGIEGHVAFKGFVSEHEKLRCMRRAHILLHASVKEGWGLVVLEAASQGTPSVVYNVPGLRDTVQDGQTGVVVVQNTPEELARASLSLLKDAQMYRRFQKNGIVWATSFRWTDVTKQSLRLLASV